MNVPNDHETILQCHFWTWYLMHLNLVKRAVYTSGKISDKRAVKPVVNCTTESHHTSVVRRPGFRSSWLVAQNIRKKNFQLKILNNYIKASKFPEKIVWPSVVWASELMTNVKRWRPLYNARHPQIIWIGLGYFFRISKSTHKKVPT